jgi:hypothetical protein
MLMLRGLFRRASILGFTGLAVALCSARIAAAESAESTESAPVTAAASEGPAHLGSAFVDPLGFLLFGPRLGVELGSGRVSVAATARWFNAGLLSHQLFDQSGSAFTFSYSVGLRGRYYFADGFAGTHLGVAAEYLRVRQEDSSAGIATNSQYFVPYAEVGYRLPLGACYADLSGGLGYALRTGSSVDNLPNGNRADEYAVVDQSSVYGTASLDLGVYF